MKWKIIIPSVVLFVVIVLGLILFALSAPKNFPVSTMYTIKNGVGLSLLSNDLVDKKIIKSPFLFKSFSVLFGGTKGIMAGDYVLAGKQNVISIAYRFSSGDFRLVPVKVTIPEGLNIFEIAKLISEKFPKVDEKSFINTSEKDEGYLFPDTYLFLPNATAEVIIDETKSNFEKRIATLDEEIANFGRPLTEIIKMASIVEEEARTTDTRRVVADILWRRFTMGMPLQVDASFKYINGKGTKDLTLDDLKIDSPYNSYLYKGLPPTPIANPGLDSIKATVTPIKTDYLYFLTDNEGNMHYARTYNEHLLNKQKYLK